MSVRRWPLNRVIAGVVVISSLVGVGYRLYLEHDARQRLEAMYPKIEALLLIHSLVNWRQETQEPPVVTVLNNLGAGSEEFQLACKNIFWETRKSPRSGELFSCFKETRRGTDIDGREMEHPQLNTSGDYWYSFHWGTVFGFEMKVGVIGDTGTRDKPLPVYEELRKMGDLCREENKSSSNLDELCWPYTYQITLTLNGGTSPVSFIASEGFFSSQNGHVRKGAGWVIYLDGSLESIRPKDIEGFLQLSFRQLGMTETAMEKNAPQLQVLWLQKDRKFVSALFSELDNLPDLKKVAEFVSGQKL